MVKLVQKKNYAPSQSRGSAPPLPPVCVRARPLNVWVQNVAAPTGRTHHPPQVLAELDHALLRREAADGFTCGASEIGGGFPHGARTLATRVGGRSPCWFWLWVRLQAMT